MYQAIVAAAESKAQFERDVEAIKAEVAAIEDEQVVLNQQLAQADSVEMHNRLAVEINTRSAAVHAYRRRLEDADPSQVRDRDARLAAQRRGVRRGRSGTPPARRQGPRDLRRTGRDDSAKQAIAAVGQASKSKVALGPSRAFTANVKLLTKIEAAVLSESVPLRNEGGFTGLTSHLQWQGYPGHCLRHRGLDGGSSRRSSPGNRDQTGQG